MALTVTHFPQQKLTFAVLFGASKTQEREILKRLSKAGSDTAHPMLLPGIFAELERIRQMNAVDEMIDELEAQISRLDNETVTTWQQSSQTKAERNRQKTKAWLDTTFSRNLLLANAALLFNMRGHLDEFSILANPRGMWRGYQPRLGDHRFPDHSPHRDLRGGTPHSRGSIPNNWHPCHHITYEEPEDMTLSGTLVASEPDFDATYQDLLQQAGMRMKDRIGSMIGEYDDKIRACTMEVDGMAMATQWVSFLAPLLL